MELLSSLSRAENVRHGCQLILDWVTEAKAREERTTQSILGWLDGVQARNEITALPRAHALAIVLQINAVQVHCQEPRARHSDLAQALETLIKLLPAKPHQNILYFRRK